MLTPGTALELTFPVTETLTAKTVGSGTLDVLATPVMIARMEQAAWTAVAPSLSPEEGTVGTWMNVKHLSATPIGVEVTLPCGTDRSRRQTIGFPRNRTRFPRSRGGRYPRTCDRSK